MTRLNKYKDKSLHKEELVISDLTAKLKKFQSIRQSKKYNAELNLIEARKKAEALITKAENDIRSVDDWWYGPRGLIWWLESNQIAFNEIQPEHLNGLEPDFIEFLTEWLFTE